MKIVFSPIWSWPFVVVAIALLLITVAVTYPSRVKHLPPFWRRLLISLRVAAAIVLAFAMIRPEIEYSDSDSRDSILYVLLDLSRSMSTPDGPGGITRRQAVLKVMSAAQELLDDLGKETEIRILDFAAESTPADLQNETPDGEQTAIGATLETVLGEANNQRGIVAVMLSDGAQRALAPNDADPRTVARRMGERGIPVYTFPFGTSGLAEAGVDVAVEELLVDPEVFEKKTVVVNAQVRLLGAANQDVTVRLLVEDRSGRQRSEQGEMVVPPGSRNAQPSTLIRTNNNEDVIPVELSFVPRQPGEFKIAVEAVPLERELKFSNNQQQTLITVRKGGIRVAYFDIARPEQKFIRFAGGSQQIQLDYKQVFGGQFRQLTRIDPAMFEPDAYDAYIIGDVPADAFDRRLLNQLAARVDEGSGLMMTGGLQSFGAGGYAQTPLAELLPVAMNRMERQPPGRVAKDLHHLGNLQMVPSQTRLHYLMRIGPDNENRNIWESLTPLQGANRLRAKNEFVEVLAETPDGTPLLFAHEVGNARILAFAGDSTWLWVTHGQEEAHQRFWRQVILWLSRKELDESDAVWVRVEPRNFLPGNAVNIEFGANDENGVPITDADFNVSITAPDGTRHELAAQSQGETSFTTFQETGPSGDYWVSVTGRKDGDLLGLDALTRFIVDERDLELDNPAADPALLEEISTLTGGRMHPPEELGEFLGGLEETGVLNRSATYVRRVSLWDNWSFLCVFIALTTLEWIVRKVRGLV